MPKQVGDRRTAAARAKGGLKQSPEAWDARVLVTGAGGFIGANLCRALGAGSGTVVAMESGHPSGWRLRSAAPQLQAERVDICCGKSVAALVRALRPTTIVNCAAFGAYPSQEEVDRIYAVNMQGLRHVLEAAQQVGGVRAVIQLGSSSEYGTRSACPDEDTPTWPDSHYATSKLAASMLTRLFAVRHRLPAFVLRLYSVYGPYEDASRLIPRLLRLARVGQLPALVRPEISRDFVHVNDVADAVARLAEHAPHVAPGAFFNVGTGICTTLRDLVALTTRLFAVRAQPVWGSMPDRAWDRVCWYADPSRAQRELGWSSRVGLAAGLQQTMAWMQASPGAVAQADRYQVVARR